jgi:hypothetical protein
MPSPRTRHGPLRQMTACPRPMRPTSQQSRLLKRSRFLFTHPCPVKIEPDPLFSIGFSALPVHLANPRYQSHVFLSALTEWAGAPRVEAAGADPEQAAQPPHRVVLLLGLDEGEAFAFCSEVNAIAFFKRSCSIFSCS